MLQRSVNEAQLLSIRGRVTQVTGTIIKAVVPGVQVGELCLLRNADSDFALKDSPARMLC